ncbi:MAG: hypothetical protein PUP92_14135, partial [Rhizonema sp. PD38]|nr:hypothetical protein [Rhizonema sp. PD38]
MNVEKISFSHKSNSQLTVELKPETDKHHYIAVQEVEYIEFYVGNAYQAMNFFVNVLGFKAVAYAGLETGVKDKVSYPGFLTREKKTLGLARLRI